MDLTLAEILALSGIVIRNIPKTSTSLCHPRHYDLENLKPNESIYTNDKGFTYVQTVKENKVNGYLITFSHGTSSMVHFDLKTNGIGDTIEAAYADYLLKRK